MSQDRSARLTSLVIRYQHQNDPVIAEEVIKLLSAFIGKEAFRFSQQSFGHATVDDLTSEGMKQCYVCMKKYKIDSGPFLQYAMQSIRGAMLHFLRDHTISIQISGSVKETMYVVNKFVSKYERDHGSTPTIGQICKSLNYSVQRVEDALLVTNYIKTPADVNDCEGVISVGLSGQQDDDENLSDKDGKRLVREVVRMRKNGADESEFMSVYGLELESARELVSVIDTFFLDAPDFGSTNVLDALQVLF